MFDSRGQPALQIDVHAIEKNQEHALMTGIAFPNQVNTWDHARSEDFEVEEQTRAEDISLAIKYINEEICAALVGRALAADQLKELDNLLVDAYDRATAPEQEAIAAQLAALLASQQVASDERAKSGGGKSPGDSPKKDTKGGKGKGRGSAQGKGGAVSQNALSLDEKREQLPRGCAAIGAISVALALAAAHVARTPFYDLVHQLANGTAKVEFSLPYLSMHIYL